MSVRIFLILTGCICLLFLAGLYTVLQGEKSALENCKISLDGILANEREGKSLTIISKDGVKLYEKIYELTSELPDEIPEDVIHMVRFAGENLFTCDRPDFEKAKKMLEFHNISAAGLDNCIILHTAEKALRKRHTGELSRIVLWKTAADIVNRYTEEGVFRGYMQNTYMQNDIWGIEAAAYSYFKRSVKFLSVSEKSWLVSLLTLGHMPDEDAAAFQKRREMLIYRLYLDDLISYENYISSLEDVPEYGQIEDLNLMPEYSELVLKELKEKGVKNNSQLVVHTNFSVETINAAAKAIEKRIKKYPEGINIALAVVNYESGGVEALAANDKWRHRTTKMRRQIGSTFKPIVYLTAVANGAQPNNLIVDKRYRYNLGNYVYSPSNFEDFYMGQIPMRLGLVHSLNNATIRLAKLTGLRSVGRMAVDLGMKARIKPYLAMPLGIFPITPLNLAKVYAVFGTYGVKKEISYISEIKNRKGEQVYMKRSLPVRVAPERETYQVIYMMKDVVRRGTARGSGLLWGTAAKTGTTDEYRDAWTVALFPPYAVVCWVGFDDRRSMGEKGTGGGRAAPVIAEFQRIVKKKSKKIDFKVPEDVVFKRVDAKSGRVLGKGCWSKKNYLEVFLKEQTPEVCGRRRVASQINSKKGG